MLIRAAPTGIAAAGIDGVTLHSLCKIPVGKSADPTRKAISEVAERLRTARYLIMDEISMASKAFFCSN